MRLTKGTTRLVILTKTLAIKIAFPFRPFAPVAMVVRALRKGDLREKLKKNSGNLARVTARSVAISSIDANRREIRISREHPEYPIALVLRSYLWGFVIVMTRGEPIENSSNPWGDRQCLLPMRLQESDLFLPCNTCRIEENLRFVDYGSPLTDEILPLLFGRRL